VDAGGLSDGHPLKTTQQLGEGDLKTGCQHLKDAQTGFSTPVFQFRDVNPTNS
jgi:hypothetical protein